MNAQGETTRSVRSPGRLWLAVQLRKPWLVAGVLAAVCFATGALASCACWPEPKVHDEFSYLLAADTFAHGRLTNPTHPEWQHFETFHVIQQPSYASKYPPGQGVVLALGEWMFDEPIVGVWLMSAVAAAVTYWMLFGFTSPTYAALGGLLWAAHPGFQLFWGQSFWGGTLAYIGGALVFGAALRVRRSPRIRDAVAMACGAVLLAVSRPFEGLAFCGLTGAWVLWSWLRETRPAIGDVALRFALPMAVVVGLGGLSLGAYHAAVTGSPFTLPYAVHEATYGLCPLFVGGTPAPKPTYRHAVIEQFHTGWELGWYNLQSTFRGWTYTKISASWIAAGFLITPMMAAGLLLARPVRWKKLTPVAVVGVLTFLVSLAVTWNLPHYMAPFVPLLFVGAVAGLRRADVISRRRLAGFRLGTTLVAVQVGLFVVAFVGYATAPHGGWWEQRAEIQSELNSNAQRHLILVQYGAGHNPHEEWVYNAADIDGSKVVWARSMDPASDAELLRYFGDRKAWLLEPEEHQLVPLPGDAAAALSTLAKHP